MENVTLEIQKRNKLGSAASARLRREDYLPAVVYAHGAAAVPAQVRRKEFVTIARRARTSSIFVLKSEDSSLNGKHAFVKEIQQDFVKKEVLHVDLVAVEENETVKIKVPVEISGEADGVKNQGGVLAVSTHYVLVSARPALVPEVIHVDVSALKLNERIRTKDLALPEGVQLKTDPELTIVAVITPRAIKTAAEEAAAGAAAEGAEGAAAEGEAAKKEEAAQ